MSGDQGYGQMTPGDGTSEFNSASFHIDQRLARCRTNVLVKVMSVTPGTGTPPTPSIVSVQLLVSMVDGQGNATEHGTINGIPVARYQGGTNAVICDPAVNDVGLMAISDRDISSVQANAGKPSTPGSQRMFDLADGVYLLSLFGAAPTQYVWMASSGMTLADANGNTLVSSSTGWAMTGNLKVTGTLEATSLETADGNLIVKGTLDVKGATTLEAGATVTGSVAASAAVTAGGGITAVGAVVAGGNIAAGGTLIAAAGAAITGGVSATSTISSGADISATTSITAGGNIVAGADLDAGGAVHAAGDVTASAGAHTLVGHTHVYFPPQPAFANPPTNTSTGTG